jgi:hypothetical protein
MPKVWSNPYDFALAWLGVMIYFTGALACLTMEIRKENQHHAGEYRQSVPNDSSGFLGR